MKRVLVIGSPGAGKSTLSAQLAKLTGLPLIHLDQMFWTKGWVMRPDDEFADLVCGAIRGDAWIMDGNYASTMRQRIERADAVIYLDYPRWLCLSRALKRIATTYGKVRADMAEGCPEQLDFEFLRYVISFRRKIRPEVEAILREHSDCVVHRFRRPREVAGFLEKLVGREQARPASA